MKLLITGAAGFLGKNLCAALRGRLAADRGALPPVERIYALNSASPMETLEEAVRDADFVFHLAGVNRPARDADHMRYNVGLTEELTELLRVRPSPPPLMLASSAQVCEGDERAGTAYARSKAAAEELVFRYGEETGARVLVYRFPNLLGKWIRPDYNSAVATFCHRIARGEAYTLYDPARELDFAFAEDAVDALLEALNGRERRCTYEGTVPRPSAEGAFCALPCTYRRSLGEVVSLLLRFRDGLDAHSLPPMPPDSFEKKLYSMFVSYLPEDRLRVPLTPLRDVRGSFQELLRTQEGGQFSVIVTAPGCSRGGHWHMAKWEIFFPLRGEGLVRQRRLDETEIRCAPLSADHPAGVCVLPGNTHELVNFSDTEELLTLVWANEPYDSARPDTWPEPV